MLPSNAPFEVFSTGLALKALPSQRTKAAINDWQERRSANLIGRLRELVLAPPAISERLHVAFLDDNNRILSVAGFGDGCAAALSLSLRELFRHALSVGARRLLMAHNHPSGDCRPSERDIEATIRLTAVAHALEIEVLDHLIFSNTDTFSMRRKGLL